MLATIIDTSFLSLRDAYKWDPNFVNSGSQSVLPTSGKKTRKKTGQSDFCWKYISLYITFSWSYSLL